MGDLRLCQQKKIVLRPFIKWAGGKNQLLPEIQKRYPKELGKDINKYAEPFVGGGAILFDIVTSYDLDKIYISDVNKELIATYKAIRDNPEKIIEILSELEKQYLSMEESDREEFFYKKRQRYNEVKKDENADETELPALFIFLNRVCFNGLYRVNSKGDFNVPHGSYKNPKICDKDNLKNISSSLKNIEIVCGEYDLSKDFIDEHTFVYFDPPYRPINQTSSFTSYTDCSFNDDDQKGLADYAKVLSEKGAKVMVSNSDPKNYSDDGFFDELYSDFNIERIPATRMINSNAEKRGKINELLITNYKV
ncbi:DNA adenine methylase [Candidatus Methanoplasma termitum]|uniref:DNA adenine methylase n=1 Tax=Candidatus Methanoplasma termitum TaxID=1577791 RepID=UPI00064E8FE9